MFQKMKFQFLLTKKIFLTLIIIHCSLIIASAQWIQQTLPISAEASSLVFFDINTGVISVAQGYTRYILRTTNSGFNWNIVNSVTGAGIATFQKIDSTTIYAGGGNNGYLAIYRTFDRGLTWDSVSKTNSIAYAGFYFVNRDTGWISTFDFTTSRIWRTTNGGVNFYPYSNPSALLYGRLFFLKEKVNGEYYGWCASNAGITASTNSGLLWNLISGMTVDNGGQIYFINKDTGWVGNVYPGGGNPKRIYITYNGGLNWSWQQMPNSSLFLYTDLKIFECVNKNILYGGGGAIYLNSKIYSVIWKTTNGGINWGYQLPDTSLDFWGVRTINFLNASTGWVYYGTNGLKTINGGGPIIYTSINSNSINISKKFILNQNYPNPFNASTKIKFDIPFNLSFQRKLESINISLKIYDILGKEIITLINEEFKPRTYEVTFDGSYLPSGIYFYKLQIEDFSKVKKMILIK